MSAHMSLPALQLTVLDSDFPKDTMLLEIWRPRELRGYRNYLSSTSPDCSHLFSSMFEGVGAVEMRESVTVVVTGEYTL